MSMLFGKLWYRDTWTGISFLPLDSSLLAAYQAFDMLLPMLGYLELIFGDSDLQLASKQLLW